MKLTVTSKYRAQELLDADESTVTHLISIIDAGKKAQFPVESARVTALKFQFDDVTIPRAGWIHVDRGDIKRIIEFARALPEDAHLLVHCEQGRSRSTAAAFIVLAARMAPGEEDRAMAEMLRAREDLGFPAKPNTLMIEIADRLLGRGGDMTSALKVADLARKAYDTGKNLVRWKAK